MGQYQKKTCTQNLDPPTFFSQNIYLIRRCFFLLIFRGTSCSTDDPGETLHKFRVTFSSLFFVCSAAASASIASASSASKTSTFISVAMTFSSDMTCRTPKLPEKKQIKKRMKVPSKCCEWEWSWRNLGECSFFRNSCCITKCRNLLTGWLSLRLFPLIFALQNFILWGKVRSFVAIHTANLVSLEIKHKY